MLSAYYMPGTVLGAICTFSYIILIVTLRSKYSNLRFTEDDIKFKELCPKSHDNK